jgi:hypothetical protein
MAFNDEPKFTKATVNTEVSHWLSISGEFDAQRVPGHELLDTTVELKIPKFCITWSEKEKFMNELAELIRKYQI